MIQHLYKDSIYIVQNIAYMIVHTPKPPNPHKHHILFMCCHVPPTPHPPPTPKQHSVHQHQAESQSAGQILNLHQSVIRQEVLPTHTDFTVSESVSQWEWSSHSWSAQRAGSRQRNKGASWCDGEGRVSDMAHWDGLWMLCVCEESDPAGCVFRPVTESEESLTVTMRVFHRVWSVNSVERKEEETEFSLSEQVICFYVLTGSGLRWFCCSTDQDQTT